jgi:radical SAM superfamily enzyme YgiQ (UPF0313 family)
MGGFILGFDGDPPDIFERQIDFIQRNGIPQSMVGLLSPIPQTPLFDRLEREGRLLISDTLNPTGDNVVPTLYFEPRMPAETLIAGYQRVLSEIYSPQRYFARSLTLISRLPELKISTLFKAEAWKRDLIRSRYTSTKFSYRLVSEFLRQIFSPVGWQQLLFLGKAMRYGLLAFLVALDLAFRGHHFFKIQKAACQAICEGPSMPAKHERQQASTDVFSEERLIA